MDSFNARRSLAACQQPIVPMCSHRGEYLDFSDMHVTNARALFFSKADILTADKRTTETSFCVHVCACVCMCMCVHVCVCGRGG